MIETELQEKAFDLFHEYIIKGYTAPIAYIILSVESGKRFNAENETDEYKIYLYASVIASELLEREKPEYTKEHKVPKPQTKKALDKYIDEEIENLSSIDRIEKAIEIREKVFDSLFNDDRATADIYYIINRCNFIITLNEKGAEIERLEKQQQERK